MQSIKNGKVIPMTSFAIIQDFHFSNGSACLYYTILYYTIRLISYLRSVACISFTHISQLLILLVYTYILCAFA